MDAAAAESKGQSSGRKAGDPEKIVDAGDAAENKGQSSGSKVDDPEKSAAAEEQWSLR